MCEDISYVGNFENGMKSGFGILYSKFKYGKRYTSSNNKLDFQRVLYKGQWENDQFNGLGRLYIPWDGQKIYEGSFKDGEFDGYGRSFTQRGTLVYEGQWGKGHYNGQGIYHFGAHFV